MAKIYKTALIFVCLSMLPATAEAATLYFSPSSGSYAVGDTLTVNIYVSSADQVMNAASGVVSFTQDKLEITSLSENGSIFTLWVQKPSLSNSASAVNFEGIILNPGFTGATGKIVTVNFRVKAAGAALLNFSSGSVLANDGKGTNILASLGDAQFSLGGAAPTVPETAMLTAEGVPTSAPQIFSPTHPDPNKWYAGKDAKFIWSVSHGTIGTRLLADENPRAVPVVTYASAIGEKEVADFADGIWYFHAQLRNADGWGEVSHFRFQVDTTPPESFDIKFLKGAGAINAKPIVLFDTADSLSGVDYYRLKIGEGDYITVSKEMAESGSYTLPNQTPGRKTIFVEAVDKAGNFTSASAEFTVLLSFVPLVLAATEAIKFLARVLHNDIALLVLLVAFLWLRQRKFSLGAFKTALKDALQCLKKSLRRALVHRRKKVIERLKKDLAEQRSLLKKETETVKKEIT